MRRITTKTYSLLTSLLTLLAALPAQATTKGLNQIVTPDIQPLGFLSLSVQKQDPTIANATELQLEIGLTKNFEIAAFQGVVPGVQILNAEYGIIQKSPYLLSVGFNNWSTRGTSPQPYIEGGYYNKAVELMAGVVRVSVEQQSVGGAVRSHNETQAVLGAAYRINPRTLLQLDYQSGKGNFATVGFTYNLTPQLQFNPSFYLSNATPRKGFGYAVLTWNVQVFK